MEENRSLVLKSCREYIEGHPSLRHCSAVEILSSISTSLTYPAIPLSGLIAKEALSIRSIEIEFDGKSCFGLFWFYVTQFGLKFSILLLVLPESWDYGCAALHIV